MPTAPTPTPDVIADLDDLIAQLRGANLLDWFRERVEAASAKPWTSSASISATKSANKRGRPKPTP
jgi:hypothetical protein